MEIKLAQSVSRAKQDDQDAIDLLVQRYETPAKRVAQNILGD